MSTDQPAVLNLEDDTDSETAILYAIGAGSMCWNPVPTGVFDSTRAAAIGQELLDHLRTLRLTQ